jgi:3-hydroxyisobutyrate dehydrogenase-like beta-hydroxyacid dehydrogenase
MTRIGFVGAGQMGSPMVERLLAAGHDVSLYARRPEIRRELGSKGATIVDSPRVAAHDADVVLACLFSDAQLVEVAEGPDGLLAGLRSGAVLASHVTGPIATVQRLDASARERGALVVDAPVSGSPDDIRSGRLTVLLGGPVEAVETCRRVVSAYADHVVATGDLGSALAV